MVLHTYVDEWPFLMLEAFRDALFNLRIRLLYLVTQSKGVKSRDRRDHTCEKYVDSQCDPHKILNIYHSLHKYNET